MPLNACLPITLSSLSGVSGSALRAQVLQAVPPGASSADQPQGPLPTRFRWEKHPAGSLGEGIGRGPATSLHRRASRLGLAVDPEAAALRPSLRLPQQPL